MLASQGASCAITFRSDLAYFGGWRCYHAWVSFARPWFLERPSCPLVVLACLSGWCCADSQLLLYQSTLHSQPGQHEARFPDNRDRAPSLGPKHPRKPGLRIRESQTGATQLGARGLWAAVGSGREPEPACLVEMLAVAPHLGDLGQVTDLEEAGVLHLYWGWGSWWGRRDEACEC